MKHLMARTVVVFSFAIASAALGSLYVWNDSKRPPVSLRQALDRAEQALGEEAKDRYCVGVSLYGDEDGKGEDGTWNLFFAATDGSKKQVSVPMRGETRVKLWNGPREPFKEERRHDLSDVKRRLLTLLKANGIDAEVRESEDQITVAYQTRVFQVYPPLADGGYAEETIEMPGPKVDGVWLRLRVVDRADFQEYAYDDGFYWTWLRGTYNLRVDRKYLAVDLRTGEKLSNAVSTAIRDALGEPTRGY